MSDNKRVLQARNEEALKKAIQRRDEAQAIVEQGEAQLENLTGSLRDIVAKEIGKQRKKLDRAQAQVDKLSRTPEQRRADQLAMRDATRDAFEARGFEFHDTGADVGTVVWRNGRIRVTMRPDSPGFAKVQLSAGSIEDMDTFAQRVGSLLDA